MVNEDKRGPHKDTHQKRSGQVKGERFSIRAGVLSDLDHGGGAHREEEAGRVVHLAVFHLKKRRRRRLTSRHCQHYCRRSLALPLPRPSFPASPGGQW